MNPKFSKYIDIAKSLYDENSDIRCQHFSIITYKNRIISIGRNSRKTNPVNLLNPKISKTGEDISSQRGSCSEMISLLRVKNTTNIPFSKISLFSIRINRNFRADLAKLCNSCAQLVDFLRVRKIWYTNEKGEFVRY